jgi:D-glycero-D-manno-heptose 1,7-bisphosphate phosphatase
LIFDGLINRATESLAKVIGGARVGWNSDINLQRARLVERDIPVKLRAVFLDRDGVLTRERPDYVKNPNELEILPGVYEPLREIRKGGFQIVVVTNQSVIGRGLATHDDMARIHEKLLGELEKHDCHLDAIYYCPHLPEDRCDRRKPQPGMILKAVRDLGIDPEKSWMIGDKEMDVEAARNAGCTGIRVPTNGDGLAEAVHEIFRRESNSSLGA